MQEVNDLNLRGQEVINILKELREGHPLVRIQFQQPAQHAVHLLSERPGAGRTGTTLDDTALLAGGH